MSKVKKAFFCQKCGNQHAKWQGQCSACKEWNTLVEEIIEKPAAKGWEAPQKKDTLVAQPIPITQIETQSEKRLSCRDEELNRVLGGGLVPGSVTLLVGEPGIGKSN